MCFERKDNTKGGQDADSKWHDNFTVVVTFYTVFSVTLRG